MNKLHDSRKALDVLNPHNESLSIILSEITGMCRLSAFSEMFCSTDELQIETVGLCLVVGSLLD